MECKEKIQELLKKMAKEGLDVMVIPTSDCHDSEYVSDHFKTREFFSGFTGSAGTLVVSEKEQGLYTDGRYFIQAAKELEGSGIKLMKMFEPGVPEIHDYVVSLLPENGTLAFDGSLITLKDGEKYEKAIEKKHGKIRFDIDPAEGIWENRPEICHTEVFRLDEKYSGESTVSKLERLRQEMEKAGATLHILTSLDDIAWLFNIRANDVEDCPVVLSYAVITKNQAMLFAKKSAFPTDVAEYLTQANVQLLPYDDIYRLAPEIQGETVLLNDERVNYKICKLLREDLKIIRKSNPTTLMKGVKNPVELDNLRTSHLKDGIAVTKFMIWLKNNIGSIPITEVSAADYLEGLRKEQDGFIEPSFHTISAYNANAAMMHYSATPESNAKLEPKGMLLVDSGGHYYEGSTDITRTFILGEITDEMRTHFTLVAKSMLNLAFSKFLYGCRGANLDILARGPLWEYGIDYKCGTGHGVGYLLNVHEGPQSFYWKISPERKESAVLEEGMVITDEPGVYIEGSHGIRTENELVCKKAEANEYGQFMEFETITYAPIDLDGIDKDQLNETDIKRLNSYHKMVYNKLSPYFEGEELEQLKKYTRAI